MTDAERATSRRGDALALVRAFGAADSSLGRRFARQQGMHPTDAIAIVEILDAEAHGGLLTPARLAERIGLTAGATSSLLNRLEAGGHVIRTRDHRDRRLVELHSTTDVHRDAEAFFLPYATALDDALASFSDDELAVLERVLRRLNRALEQGDDTDHLPRGRGHVVADGVPTGDLRPTGGAT